MLHGLRLQELEHQFERKGVLLGQRDHDAVVGGRGLQLEIERAAEALAQRQSPGPIDARSERRVDHQLHAAAFIEEALGHHGLLGRQRVQRGHARQNVGDGLLRAAFVEAAFFDQELHRAIGGSLPRSLPALRQLLPTVRTSARRFAIPERNRWRRATRILHAHAARLHALDAPGAGAEQKHVAGQALDREIFVHACRPLCLRARRPRNSSRCPESRRRR